MESPILRASEGSEQTRATEKSGVEGIEALVGQQTITEGTRIGIEPKFE
jgi:hypothetical protein